MGLLPTPASKLFLSPLLHNPFISHYLISVSNLVKDNHISITFDSNGFVFKDMMTKKTILKGPCRDGLYKIVSRNQKLQPTGLSAVRISSTDKYNRLIHPHQRVLQMISQTNPSLHISPLSSIFNSCKTCKGQILVFDIFANRSKAPLDLIHSDVWGPSLVPSHQGFRYYVIFVDD